MTKIIDGQAVAKEIEDRVKKRIGALRLGLTPRLVSLVMKDDEPGQVYARMKQEAVERVGAVMTQVMVDGQDTDRVWQLIEKYNQAETVHGVMIQRPGPDWWREKQAMSRDEFNQWWELLVNKIEPKKDVDGLGKNSAFIQATAKAVLLLLDRLRLRPDKARIVVVGQRGMVGRALLSYLKQGKQLVKGVSASDKDLSKNTLKADVLISASGRKNLIKPEMVKRGVIVIDAGWPDGDVEFDKVKHKVRQITPVPGGIGPMGIACLLENLLEAVYSKS